MKIFGIGLIKTGSHSLASSLETLGYRTVHYLGSFPWLSLEQGSVRLDTDRMSGFEGFTDIVFSRFYKDLDKAFPGSKFILTVRDEKAWLRSAWFHIKRYPAKDKDPVELRLRKDLFGTTGFCKKSFLAAYRKHTEDVKGYFSDRPEDLLVMDICGGDGWDKLCPFLHKVKPHAPFPRKFVTGRPSLRHLASYYLNRILGKA